LSLGLGTESSEGRDSSVHWLTPIAEIWESRYVSWWSRLYYLSRSWRCRITLQISWGLRYNFPRLFRGCLVLLTFWWNS
jgi:hypothetical protein